MQICIYLELFGKGILLEWAGHYFMMVVINVYWDIYTWNIENINFAGRMVQCIMTNGHSAIFYDFSKRLARIAR